MDLPVDDSTASECTPVVVRRVCLALSARVAAIDCESLRLNAEEDDEEVDASLIAPAEDDEAVRGLDGGVMYCWSPKLAFRTIPDG